MADNEKTLVEAQKKIQFALDSFEITDPDTRKQKKPAGHVEGVFERKYHDGWGTRYARTRKTAMDALSKILVTNETGTGVVVNNDELDRFHANLDRLLLAIHSDSESPPTISGVKKKEVEDFVDKAKKRLVEIKDSFNADPLLKDFMSADFLMKDASKDVFKAAAPKVKDSIEEPQAFYDRGKRLIAKLNNIYTQTEHNTVHAGSRLSPFPPRRAATEGKAGEGADIGKALDLMQNALDALHDKANDPQNKGVVITGQDEVKSHIEAFNKAKDALKAELDKKNGELKDLPANASEKTLMYEVFEMQKNIRVFETSIDKDFKKRMEISAESKGAGSKKVGYMGEGAHERVAEIGREWKNLNIAIASVPEVIAAPQTTSVKPPRDPARGNAA